MKGKWIYEGWLYMVDIVDCCYPALTDKKLSENEIKQLAADIISRIWRKAFGEPNVSNEAINRIVNEVLSLLQDNVIHFMINHKIKHTDLEKELSRFRGKKVRITIEVLE